jgi:hypothetical protein
MITVEGCEKKVRGGDWRYTAESSFGKGLILTDLTDQEHDQILNVMDGLDPYEGLKGYKARLLLEDKQEDDPAYVNLTFAPSTGQVIRHQDKFFLVRLVVQGSNYGIAVYAERINHDDLLPLAKTLVNRNYL